MEEPKAKVRQEFLPSDLWSKLLSATRDEPFKDWLKAMLLSGARVQEMLKIEARHLDRKESRLILDIEESSAAAATAGFRSTRWKSPPRLPEFC